MMMRKVTLFALIAVNALGASSAHASLWQSIRNQASKLFEKPYVYATATIGLSCMGALACWLYKKHTKVSTDFSDAPASTNAIKKVSEKVSCHAHVPQPVASNQKSDVDQKEQLLHRLRMSTQRLQEQKKLHDALDTLIKQPSRYSDRVFYGTFCAQIKALRQYLAEEQVAAIDSMPTANNAVFWQKTLPRVYSLNKKWNEGLVGRIYEAEMIIAQIESKQ